jgi:hypothetical protein
MLNDESLDAIAEVARKMRETPLKPMAVTQLYGIVVALAQDLKEVHARLQALAPEFEERHDVQPIFPGGSLRVGASQYLINGHDVSEEEYRHRYKEGQ